MDEDGGRIEVDERTQQEGVRLMLRVKMKMKMALLIRQCSGGRCNVEEC